MEKITKTNKIPRTILQIIIRNKNLNDHSEVIKLHFKLFLKEIRAKTQIELREILSKLYVADYS